VMPIYQGGKEADSSGVSYAYKSGALIVTSASAS
jgi:hypothetical protein